MKSEIIHWAYEADFPPSIKASSHAVLIALAYSANFKTGACFPSIPRLCHLTKLGATAVKRGIKILKKEGLITIVSGKGKRKSNRYTINFHKIEKRQTEKRQIGSENDLLNESQRSESDLSIGRNATSNNKHTNNTHADAVLSSSIIEQSIPDEDAPQNDGLYLGRGRHKPIGLQRAKNVVTDWLQADGKEMYPNLDDEHRERLIEVLSNVISLYTEPPKVGPKDIENILDTLTKRSDWVIVEDTIENVKDQACMQQIDNPRAYILSAIKKNIEVGTAVREW